MPANCDGPVAATCGSRDGRTEAAMQGASPIASPSSINPTRAASTPSGRLSQNCCTALSGSAAAPAFDDDTAIAAGVTGWPTDILIVMGMVIPTSDDAAGADGIAACGFDTIV